MLEEENQKRAGTRDVSRRKYIGAVAGSIFATASISTASAVDTSNAKEFDVGERISRSNGHLWVDEIFTIDTLAYYSNPDEITVQMDSGVQYVFANIGFSNLNVKRPEVSEFSLIVNDQQYRAGKLINGIPLFAIRDAYRDRMGMVYHSNQISLPNDASQIPPKYKNPVFTLGFAVPAGISATNVGVGLTTDERAEAVWNASSEMATTLQRNPEFEVAGLDGPASIKQGERFEMSVSVRNTGNRWGVFEAVVGPQGENHNKRISLSVPAGETITEGMEFPALPKAESPKYQVMQGSTVLAEREISVRNGEQ